MPQQWGRAATQDRAPWLLSRDMVHSVPAECECASGLLAIGVRCSTPGAALNDGMILSCKVSLPLAYFGCREETRRTWRGA